MELSTTGKLPEIQTDPLNRAHLGGWTWIAFCGAILRTLATALTGFGIVASPALAGVATVFGLASVGFAATSKRLERKVTKHENIYTLALANETLSMSWSRKPSKTRVLAMLSSASSAREVEKYHELKAAIRDGVTKSTNDVATQTQAPDLEKLKNELRKEVKQEFQKKISLLTAVSKSDLKD